MKKHSLMMALALFGAGAFPHLYSVHAAQIEAGPGKPEAPNKAANRARPAQPYVWSTDQAVILLPENQVNLTEVACRIRTITAAGWGPEKETTLPVQEGKVGVLPLAEGIHIVEMPALNQTVRFLAVAPPATLDSAGRKVLTQRLPLAGKKLLSRQPFTILAVGDSVTATGDYAGLLAMLLGRATGNSSIQSERRGHSGRSIDATIRHWPEDTRGLKPDLALIKYGLNEQVTFYPLDAYLEQYATLTRQFREQFGADTVFLQPTPHLDIPLDEAARNPNSNDASFIFRTIGFAAALEPLGKELKVPVAPTFHAIWARGGATLEAAARQMWPFYPPGYSTQFNSLLETDGKGDTIHPNALGHLQMARAVFNTLTSAEEPQPWRWEASSSWTQGGAISTLKATNTSGARRAGKLRPYPLLRGQLNAAPVSYDLAPGQSIGITVGWPQARQPQDLLVFPNDQYLAPGHPTIPVVDTSNGPTAAGVTSHVHAVSAPFRPEATFLRQRSIVAPGGKARVQLQAGKTSRTLEVAIPNQPVGSIPLLEKVQTAEGANWAAAELRYTRFGAALPGEATLDGDLNEWSDAVWVPVGEPSQARFSSGPQDNRESPAEAYLRWAFKAGKDGLFLAARGQGKLEQDTFTLFFDSRPPNELGTAGRYYWASGKLMPNGKLDLRKGETTLQAPGLAGTWKPTPEGLQLEAFVPYSVFASEAWPQSGDLGFSLWWSHLGPDGKRTQLMWSEEGHPWTSRWYGVLRRTSEPNRLPYMVRLK